jgi:hypothetical protein
VDTTELEILLRRVVDRDGDTDIAALADRIVDLVKKQIETEKK